jgi:hypothetical protein
LYIQTTVKTTCFVLYLRRRHVWGFIKHPQAIHCLVTPVVHRSARACCVRLLFVCTVVLWFALLAQRDGNITVTQWLCPYVFLLTWLLPWIERKFIPAQQSGISPLILSLGARRRWVFNFTPRPPYPLELMFAQLPGGWLEVSTRKVLRPATSAQVFLLGIPVSNSKCWDGSQVFKLTLHASHVALPK